MDGQTYMHTEGRALILKEMQKIQMSQSLVNSALFQTCQQHM